MYPLLLKPPVMDYLWGGTRLKEEYNIQSDKNPLAEAWMLSSRPDCACVIENGELKGKTFGDALELWGADAIGKNAAKFPYFPLLIKLIDAKQQLSVQVHPNDEYAMKNESEFGKTEMWYVVDCEEGASLYYGFNKDLTKDEFREKIESNDLDSVCNKVAVKKGDCFFIPSGMLHSIGAGILVAEVQQNSNTTYRVYDFGRVGADGKPRELHIDKALDVTTLKKQPTEIAHTEYVAADGGKIRPLAECEYFTADLYKVESEMTIGDADSFVSLVCLSGECVADGIEMKKGASLFVPAGMSVKVKGDAELIVSKV